MTAKRTAPPTPEELAELAELRRRETEALFSAVHPLFAEWAEHRVNAGLDLGPHPIQTIDVRRITAIGQGAIVGMHEADELQSEDQIRELYGPGRYELVARAYGRRMIVGRVTLQIAELPKAPGAAAAPASGESALLAETLRGVLSELRELRSAKPLDAKGAGIDGVIAFVAAQAEAQRAAAAQMAQGSREQTAAMLQMVTTFANAQVANVRQAAERAPVEGISSKVEEMERLLGLAMNLAEQFRAQGPTTDGDVGMINAVVEGVRAFREDPAAAAAVRAAAAAAESSGGNGAAS